MEQSSEFFQWKESFSVGIDEIDDQHRFFLELLNNCYAKVAENSEKVVDRALVQELKEYVEVHFAYEEKVLQYVGYEKLEQHRVQHDYFRSLVAELDATCQEGNLSGVKLTSTLSILRDWFLHHVLEEDMRYVRYLKHTV